MALDSVNLQMKSILPSKTTFFFQRSGLKTKLELNSKQSFK